MLIEVNRGDWIFKGGNREGGEQELSRVGRRELVHVKPIWFANWYLLYS